MCVFHDRSLLMRCFRGFVLPILEYCSAVWCSAADTHQELLNRAGSGAWFLTGGVFECDIAHRRSVAVMCMLYKIMCNLCTRIMMLYLARMCQCGYTRCHGRASLYLCTASLQNLAGQQDFCSPLSVPLERSCLTRIRWVGLASFKSCANVFLLA